MHEQIGIIPISSNPIRSTLHQIYSTPPFKHWFHFLQYFHVFSVICHHDWTSVIFSSDNIDELFSTRSLPIRNRHLLLNTFSLSIGIAFTIDFCNLCRFESLVQAFLKTFGNVFGGSSEAPSVLGVVLSYEGGGDDCHPGIVSLASVGYSFNLLTVR